MRILIISKTIDAKNDSTIGFCNNVIKICQGQYGCDNVDVVRLSIPDAFTFAKNFLFKQPFGYNKAIKKELGFVAKNHYNCILLMSSVFLGYVKKFFQKSKTLVFFQNVESHYYSDKYKSRRSLRNLLTYLYCSRSEKLIKKYGTFISALNNRDSVEIMERYNRRSNIILPVSFRKKEKNYLESKILNTERYLLFIGSNFFANVDGICWFIEKVLPHIQYKLVVVGTCCEGVYKKINCFENKKIELFGFVDDIDEIIVNASAVVCPIFSGSGMKTKTIEALAFGKTIFGTEEAFAGIDCDFDTIGALCKDDNDFIRVINQYKKPVKFNSFSYELFEQRFDFNIFSNNLIKFLENNCK